MPGAGLERPLHPPPRLAFRTILVRYPICYPTLFQVSRVPVRKVATVAIIRAYPGNGTPAAHHGALTLGDSRAGAARNSHLDRDQRRAQNVRSTNTVMASSKKDWNNLQQALGRWPPGVVRVNGQKAARRATDFSVYTRDGYQTWLNAVSASEEHED